jgi:hypothetical protein
MDPEHRKLGEGDEPVLVHVTVCKAHVRKVRRWLRTRMHPQDDVMTCGTEALMRNWGQIQDTMQVPTWTPVRAAI